MNKWHLVEFYSSDIKTMHGPIHIKFVIMLLLYYAIFKICFCVDICVCDIYIPVKLY